MVLIKLPFLHTLGAVVFIRAEHKLAQLRTIRVLHPLKIGFQEKECLLV